MAEAQVRAAIPADYDELQQLRLLLWPDASGPEDESQVKAALAGGPVGTLPTTTFVAEVDGTLVGFLEAGLRSHADGCDIQQPVGYVEGWFVAEPWRSRGIGTRLLAAAEDWARRQGCKEMASDALIVNELSQRVHEALGFEVVDRCVHYRKAIGR